MCSAGLRRTMSFTARASAVTGAIAATGRNTTPKRTTTSARLRSVCGRRLIARRDSAAMPTKSARPRRGSAAPRPNCSAPTTTSGSATTTVTAINQKVRRVIRSTLPSPTGRNVHRRFRPRLSERGQPASRYRSAGAQPALEHQNGSKEAEDKQEFTGTTALKRGTDDEEQRREREDRSRGEDEY